MSDVDGQVAEILKKTEASIAGLASERAAARDYLKANALIVLAQKIASAEQEWTSGGLTNRVVARERIKPPPSEATQSKPSAVEGGMAPELRQYPRFRREGDVLVKIGWSKSENSTYEHRSPRQILDQLIEAVKAVASADQLFTTEQLMPLRSPDRGELPSYQSYLCLGWLVAVGAICKHGRQGYTVSSSTEMERRVADAWAQLPTL